MHNKQGTHKTKKGIHYKTLSRVNKKEFNETDATRNSIFIMTRKMHHWNYINHKVPNMFNYSEVALISKLYYIFKFDTLLGPENFLATSQKVWRELRREGLKLHT